jgi:hypothetical protein
MQTPDIRVGQSILTLIASPRLTSLLAIACLSAAVPARADQMPSSRSGIVLFSLPADRQRVEEMGYTALKRFGTSETYEIRIRPPFETWGSAADAVETHARWLATAYRVQPATTPTAFRHSGGFDVALRTFFLGAPDGRVVSVLVGVLKSGTRAAVIEFVAAKPQAPEAIQQMASFIDGCRLAHTQILAAGTPPLTVYDVEETIDILQWLIDAPLTLAQRAVIRSHIVDDWRKKDAGTIANVGRILEFRNQLVKLPPAQQNLVRRQNEAELIAGLRTEKDSVSTLLLETYESAHTPIAAGVPALTRQQADAALDLFYFMAGQLEGVQATPSAAAKSTWAGNLARSWPTLPAETRNAIAAMPVTWALTQAVWTEMTPTIREQVKATYAQMDVVKGLRSDFIAARNAVGQTPLRNAGAPRQAETLPAHRQGLEGFNAAAPVPTPPESSNAVDVNAQMAKINQNHAAMMSMMTTQYNSTISMMASIGNMSGPRYTVR